MKNEISKNLSPALKKYLVGKELISRLKKAEEDYIHALEIGDQEYIKTHKLDSKGKIADRFGRECHLSGATVVSYAEYAEVLDKIKEKNEKLVQQLLSGETNMSYRDLKKILDVL